MNKICFIFATVIKKAGGNRPVERLATLQPVEGAKF